MRYSVFLLLSIAALLFCCVPVMGVTTYLTEGPEMAAAITGPNEFSPGQDAIISVIVQNRGLNIDKFVMDGTIERDDAPTTAKLVTVGLLPDNAPVVVKSDPQNIGDLPSQRAATVRIVAKITTDATEGEYTLPLTIRFQYLAASRQEQADVLESDYQWKNVTLPLTIRIKPTVRIEVIEAVPSNLSVGSSGYLDLKIRNSGLEDGKKATVRLVRNGNSPIIPTDSSIYIGDFNRNATVGCRYKVAISDNAESQTYPVDVMVSYENRNGETVNSSPDTVGIPVSGKLTFAVVSDPVSISAGSDQVISIRYRNTGNATAYNAQARITAVDPFTSSDNTAYLGDLGPGQSAAASYRISVAAGAEAKEYDLDTEVRFRDELGNSQVSDTFRAGVRVAPAPFPIMNFLAPAVLAAALVIGAGYYLLVMRKKK